MVALGSSLMVTVACGSGTVENEFLQVTSSVYLTSVRAYTYVPLVVVGAVRTRLLEVAGLDTSG